MDEDIQRGGGADDFVGHGDIGIAGAWVTARVVVNEDHRRCPQLQRALDDLAGIDGRVVNRAHLLYLVGDQLVFAVEEQDPELLALFMRHGGVTIINQFLPRA